MNPILSPINPFQSLSEVKANVKPEKKKRERKTPFVPSAYNNFVKEKMNHPDYAGIKPRDRMKKIAEEWRTVRPEKVPKVRKSRSKTNEQQETNSQ